MYHIPYLTAVFEAVENVVLRPQRYQEDWSLREALEQRAGYDN